MVPGGCSWERKASPPDQPWARVLSLPYRAVCCVLYRAVRVCVLPSIESALPSQTEDTRPQSFGACKESLTGDSTSLSLEYFSLLNPGEYQPAMNAPVCCPTFGLPQFLSVCQPSSLSPASLDRVSWQPSQSPDAMHWRHHCQACDRPGKAITDMSLYVLPGFISSRLFPGICLTQVKISKAIVTRHHFPRVRLDSILPERAIIFQPVMHKERHVSLGHSPLAEAGRS